MIQIETPTAKISNHIRISNVHTLNVRFSLFFLDSIFSSSIKFKLNKLKLKQTLKLKSII